MRILHSTPAQVVVISRNTAFAFDSEAELTQTLLGEAPLQTLLIAVRNRAPEFVDHSLAMNELRELLEFVTAQSVAAKLTTEPQPLQTAMSKNDRIDALRYSFSAWPIKAPDVFKISLLTA